jgi:solute carrier family 25 protein 39/40
MIYWFNYETFKTYLLKKQNKSNLDKTTTFICGAISGSIAATITCPLDVVKTYRQIQLGELNTNNSPRKTIDVIKDIYRMKGFKALFTGLAPRVAKVSTSCAIMITTFEFFKGFFEKTSEQTNN